MVATRLMSAPEMRFDRASASSPRRIKAPVAPSFHLLRQLRLEGGEAATEPFVRVTRPGAIRSRRQWPRFPIPAKLGAWPPRFPLRPPARRLNVPRHRLSSACSCTDAGGLNPKKSAGHPAAARISVVVANVRNADAVARRCQRYRLVTSYRTIRAIAASGYAPAPASFRAYARSIIWPGPSSASSPKTARI